MINKSIKNGHHSRLNQQVKGGFDFYTIAGIIITLFLWASAFAGIRSALQSYSPGHLVLLRFLIASLVLFFYSVIRRMPLPQKKDIPGIMALGFLGVTIYHTGLTFGEQSVTAGSASLLIATSPIFTAIFARYFLGEKLKWIGWIGIGMSFLGTGLVAMGEGGGISINPGSLLILLAAFSTSLYFIFQKKYLQRYSAIQMATFTIWSGTIFMLIFSPNLTQAIMNANRVDTLAVIYLGIFPAAIAYMSWMYVLSRIPASQAASFLYLSPVLALLIAWVWLKEIPVFLAILGGIFLLIGVILVNTWGRTSS